jgi:hypothetical protein
MATNPTVPQGPGRAAGGRNFKTIVRIEKAVRLESVGLADAEIARHIGLTPNGLATLKTSPEYQATRTRMLTGVISDYEEGLGEDLHYVREKVREAIPHALQVLVSALHSSEEKNRIHAAESLLDRDGHMSKVSRIGLPAEDQGGLGTRIDPTVADGLIATLSLTNQGANNGNTTVSPNANAASNNKGTNNP